MAIFSKDDVRYIERHAKQGLRSFIVLLPQHQKPLAEDALQDTWEKYISKIQKGELPNEIKNNKDDSVKWFVKVVKNDLINRINRENKLFPFTNELIRNYCYDPHQKIEADATLDYYLDMLYKHSPLQWITIIFHDIQGWKFKEIAENIRISYTAPRSSENAVKLHHAKAMKYLKKLVEIEEKRQKGKILETPFRRLNWYTFTKS